MTADAFPVTIFHNPDCGTSRNTLGMIRAAGYEPEVVEYLKAGWTEPQLRKLLADLGATPRDVLREKGTPAEALGLLGDGVTADRVIQAMVANPILVNRPIVVTPKGTALCRPSERVWALLDQLPLSFTKEDGEVASPRKVERRVAAP